MTDSTNRSSTQTLTITVGNTRPQLEVEGPVQGGFYEWTDTVHYRIGVTDPEDGTVDCNEVNLVIGLGHDEHSHPIDQKVGCEGDVVTDVIPEGHSPSSRLFYVLRASYRDHGAPGSGVLEGSQEITLRPKFWEAELYDRSQGVQQTVTSGASAGRRVGSISRGDWWAYENVNLRNIDSITARVSSGSNNNGRIEFRLDAPDGPMVAEVSVPNTGGWDSYRTLDPVPVSDPGGTHTLYLVAADDQAGDLLDLDWLRFNGMGVASKLAAHPSAEPSAGPAPLADDAEGRRAGRAGRHHVRVGPRGRQYGRGRRGDAHLRGSRHVPRDVQGDPRGHADRRGRRRRARVRAARRHARGDARELDAVRRRLHDGDRDVRPERRAVGGGPRRHVPGLPPVRLSGLPAGYASGTPYLRVEQQVVQTGRRRRGASSPIAGEVRRGGHRRRLPRLHGLVPARRRDHARDRRRGRARRTCVTG